MNSPGPLPRTGTENGGRTGGGGPGRAWASAALTVAALTLTSRIVGFGRSVVFSKTVGDTCLGDAYNAANTLPNTLFEIVAGGVLAGVVVPVVARHVAGGRRAEASRTVSALLTWTLLVLTVPAVAALAGAGLYGAAFGKPACAGAAQVIAQLLVMFAPQVWFYGVAVVCAGVLQAHHRFLAAAAAPLLSSLVVITSYAGFAAVAGRGTGSSLAGVSGEALLILGLGTTAGVVTLAATTAVGLARLGLRLRPAVRFAPGDRTVVAAVALSGIAGLVLQQVSILEISWLAQRTGDPGALTRYVWAAAIYLLPYAVLAAPLLQLVFPRLSAAAERGGDALAGVVAAHGPVLVLAACLGAALLPATAVPVARVFVLGPGSGDTLALAGPIAAFAPAVVGFSVFGLATRMLLAEHRARDAGLAGIVAWGTVIVAVAVGRAALPDSWLVVGFGAATSVGMVVGAVIGWRLARRGGGLPRRVLARPLGIGAAAAVVASLLPGWFALRFAQAGAGAALAGGAAAAVGCLLLYALIVAATDRPMARRALAAVRDRGRPRGHGSAAR